MLFRLTIDSSNAAFDDAAEVARILRELALTIEAEPNRSKGPLRDVNGNTVGAWEKAPERSPWDSPEDPPEASIPDRTDDL